MNTCVLSASQALSPALLSALGSGQCAILPTETVYGLAANALDAEAVQSIFRIKSRPSANPLIVHTRDVASIPQWVSVFPPLAKRLFEALSPGPLSIILPKKPCIPDIVSAGWDTVAIRIPAHPVMQRLLHALDFPLAAPSANLSGKPSPTRLADALEDLEDAVPFAVDGGICAWGVESTVIRLEAEGVRILRYGGISPETLERLSGQSVLPPPADAPIQSPGVAFPHYQPKAQVLLFDSSHPPAHIPKDALVLYWKAAVPPASYQIRFTSLEEYAQSLFHTFREADQAGCTRIWCEMPPPWGLGLALADRLKRASLSCESTH